MKEPKQDVIMMDGEPLEIGDRVYCLVYGCLDLKQIIKPNPYPLRFVDARGDIRSYTDELKIHNNYCNRTLYWQKPEITPPPKLKKRVKVWDWVSYCPKGFPLIIHRGCTEQWLIETGLNVKRIEGTEREVEQ